MAAEMARQVCVAGAGAIGCLVATELTRAGISTAVLCRTRESAMTFERDGVRFSGVGGDRVVRLDVSSDPMLAASADLVCLCVKSYQTESVLNALYGVAKPGCTFVSLQNGLGNTEKIALRFPDAPVVAAITSNGVTRVSAAHFVHAGAGSFEVAPVSSGAEAGARRFTAILREAGFEVKQRDDADAMRWRKVLINAAINPVAALAGITNGELLERSDLMEQALAAAAEVVAIAQKLKIDLGPESPSELVRDVCRRTAANRCSMLQDLELGRRTEIDSLNGAVAAAGSGSGVPAPVNTALTGAIHARETRSRAS